MTVPSAQAQAGSGVIDGRPLFHADDRISAPEMRPTRPIYPDSAATFSAIDRIGVQKTARSKRVACGAGLRQTYRLGRVLPGKSQIGSVFQSIEGT